MPAPGTRLGRYTLHELINSGGMSEIWLATDDEGRSFAVRTMLNNSTFAFTERKRFNTGAETLKACQDGKYIIGYVEHGKIGGELALVMEYVEGANLKLLMGANDPVLTDDIAQVLIDFASALEVVHHGGFMHLDVKPENVLLSRNGSLRSVKANVELFSIVRTANKRPASSVASQISDMPPELIISCSV